MYKFKNSIILVLLFTSLAYSQNVLNKNSDSVASAEAELSSYLQKIEDTPAIPILGDIVVLQKTELVNKEPKENEDIVERCARFLAERELKIKLPNNEARDLLADARGKKKRIARILLPILLLLKLKAAIVLPIILSIIALVSFKGFGLSLAALAVAGTTAIKNIFEHAGSKVSYEVVPSSVGHWSRSGLTDNSVASAYQYE